MAKRKAANGDGTIRQKKDGTWEELFDTLFPHAPRDVIDFKILDDCITEYVKNLNNKKWLEENARYSVKKNNGVTQYCLSPDVYDFLKASVVQFEDAFVESSDYDDLYEELRGMRSGSKYTDTEVVFGVKAGKLTEFSFDISGPYEGLTYGDEVHIEADFYDFCYDEVYAVMMTSSPWDVFGKPRWDWEADFNYLMRDCAMTLAIVEVSLYE